MTTLSPSAFRLFRPFVSQTFLAVLFAGALPWHSVCGAPRVLEAGRVPNDVRLQPPKDLDGYFPFRPSPTTEAWAQRAERVRRQMLVSQGLWPMPAKTPLNAVIHGRIERDTYTVEKVYFESAPGFFVTGNLYRPRGRSGKSPGVLCPHGHWANGRFTDAGLEGVHREIVMGGERFEEGGRSPLQARCVQLARMGCVVFHYDMIGYADSLQISFEIAHRFAKQRTEMNSTEDWGLFSPQAEANLQSVMGLQSLNSVRVLDFLLDLPDVDPARIAVTGASGGGTQTFMVCGMDPRPTLAFPAVMVSTAMQGGCTCENASLLRVGTGNVEFAALFAPKPLGMTSAEDWTREMATKGFPELKQHYAMHAATNNVMLKRGDGYFGHNYNYPSRAALSSWANKHFKLGYKDPIVEEDYKRLTEAEMSVWNDQHPKPAGGPDFERKLLRWWMEDAQKQLQQARQSSEEFRKIYGGGIDVVIGRSLAEVGSVEWDMKDKADRGRYLEMTGLLRNTTHHEELPIVFLHPKEWNGRTVVWIDEHGKSGLFAARDVGSRPKPEIQELLDSGSTVVGVDLLYQGEFLADGQPVSRTRRVKNTREAAAYTFGYNHTLFAQRVHDVLTLVSFVKNNERKSERVDLVGLGGAGPWVAAAWAQSGRAVDRLVVDTGGFRFAKVADIHDVNFLPGGVKYGDLPGMLALGAPGKLWLAGEGKEAPELVNAAYKAESAQSNLTVFAGRAEQARAAVVKWLLAKQ
ncbi:MAG: acetylxylan esterase [Verrucomicrobia bacterium]|nr:acetylxylan esterase [Verrucomicrobiota bacterium]